jgi:hypothetical protein
MISLGAIAEEQGWKGPVHAAGETGPPVWQAGAGWTYQRRGL